MGPDSHCVISVVFCKIVPMKNVLWVHTADAGLFGRQMPPEGAPWWRHASQSPHPLWRRVPSPGAVARACNPSSREAEAGGSFELRTSELQRTMSIGCPH